MDWLREKWFWALVLIGLILLHTSEAYAHRGPRETHRNAPDNDDGPSG